MSHPRTCHNLDCRYNSSWRHSQRDGDRNAFTIRDDDLRSRLTEVIWQAPRREDGPDGQLVAVVRESVLRGDPEGATTVCRRVWASETAAQMADTVWSLAEGGFPLLWEMDVAPLDLGRGSGGGRRRPGGLLISPQAPWVPDPETWASVWSVIEPLGLGLRSEVAYQMVRQMGGVLEEALPSPLASELAGDTTTVWSRERWWAEYDAAGLWRGLPEVPLLHSEPAYWTLLLRMWGIWWETLGTSLRVYLLAMVARQLWWYRPDPEVDRGMLLYSAIETLLPDYLQGQALAEVSPEHLQLAREMAEELRRVAAGAVAESEVYSAEARVEAVRKLEQLEVIVGLPARIYPTASLWAQYPIEVWSGAGFWRLWLTLHRYYWSQVRRLLREDLPPGYTGLDRGTFGHAVNAFYLPQSNSILIPPSIIGPPFCCREDPWVRYGSLGVILGHEIINALDINGSRYDADGIQRQWWDAATRARYYAQLARMTAHYSRLEDQGQPLEWETSTGEDWSDIGGLQLALAACERRYGPGTRADWQAFYRSWAQTMRSTHTLPDPGSDALDPHPPGAIRAWAPSSHTDRYYEAYQVYPGDPTWLAPEERVRWLAV